MLARYFTCRSPSFLLPCIQSELREQYLGKVKEVVALQLQLDAEVRRSVRQTADLAAAREAAARVAREIERLQVRGGEGSKSRTLAYDCLRCE